MIEAIFARQILDSRGNPTIEVEVLTEGDGVGRAAVPSGASTGIYEAIELRDGGNHFNGLGVGAAVANVNDTIAPALAGEDAFDQGGIDQLLIDLDGTDNKAKLGANAILGVSMAVARAAADELGLELFRYLGGAHANLLPVPLMNVLNGGAHADNNLDVQEFMIAPHGAASFSEALQMGAETYHALKRKLAEKGLSTAVGDEGGFAPNLDGNEQALALLTEAIKAAGYEPGADISIAMDLAASQFFADGKYTLGDASLDAAGMTALCGSWVDNFPVVSLEDPLDERDFEGWAEFTGALGHKVQIVGDDLFATNPQRLEDGIKAGSANSILVKVNQIGTITEAFAAVRMAKDAGYSTVISHRSGETEDAIIADLSVAWNAGQIKAGAPARSERVAKYNQLLRIEEQLDTSARYGSPALRKA